jgi:hypothetical protein
LPASLIYLIRVYRRLCDAVYSLLEPEFPALAL